MRARPRHHGAAATPTAARATKPPLPTQLAAHLPPPHPHQSPPCPFLGAPSCSTTPCRPVRQPHLPPPTRQHHARRRRW
jgi:hypothetical protein